MKALVNPSKAMGAQRLERRTSERLIRNMKVGNTCLLGESSKKRNLEGNNYSHLNSFSVLDNDALIARSISMGVNLDANTYAPIDMLKKHGTS